MQITVNVNNNRRRVIRRIYAYRQKHTASRGFLASAGLLCVIVM